MKSNKMMLWVGVGLVVVTAIAILTGKEAEKKVAVSADFKPAVIYDMGGKFDKSFNEGDTVILDGNDALIVKVGLSETVFGVYSDKGYTWRYVPNERIPTLKLEKVINKDLHLDTEAEKAEKLQSLIDRTQDCQIGANKTAIEEIKNGANK